MVVEEADLVEEAQVGDSVVNELNELELNCT